MLDEPVEKKIANSTIGNGERYSHPCFGQAIFSRTNGDYGKMYGSRIDAHNVIKLEITGSECEQSLGKDWYIPKGKVVEVLFTQTQFAELLTNMNGSSIPCTFHFRADKGFIKQKSIPSEIDHIKETIDSKINNVSEKGDKFVEHASSLLEKKGALNKDEKKQIQSCLRQLKNLASSSIPYYVECAQETIEKATQESKADIEAFSLHAVTVLGLEVLKNPTVLDKLLENTHDK